MICAILIHSGAPCSESVPNDLSQPSTGLMPECATCAVCGLHLAFRVFRLNRSFFHKAVICHRRHRINFLGKSFYHLHNRSVDQKLFVFVPSAPCFTSASFNSSIQWCYRSFRNAFHYLEKRTILRHSIPNPEIPDQVPVVPPLSMRTTRNHSKTAPAPGPRKILIVELPRAIPAYSVCLHKVIPSCTSHRYNHTLDNWYESWKNLCSIITFPKLSQYLYSLS